MHDLLLHAIATIALLTGNALLIGLGFIIARWSSASPPESGREEAPNLHQDLKGVTLALAAMGERLLKLEVQIGQLREQAGQEGLPLTAIQSRNPSRLPPNWLCRVPGLTRSWSCAASPVARRT
jgi:hypothetical protein